MAKIKLTDRFIKSRKAAAAGERDGYADAEVPGLALRVTDRGHKSFVLVARYPMSPRNPTRRALGDYGALTLDKAREKARIWLGLIGKGIDPRTQEQRDRAAQLRQQINTFQAVAEAYLERHVKGPAYVELERIADVLRQAEPKLTKAQAWDNTVADRKNLALVAQSKREGIAKKSEAERIIRAEFIKRWAARPITEIASDEAAAAILAIVKRGSPYQAHNAFGYLRGIYNWAIGTGQYGLDASPVERLRPSKLIGKRKARPHTLDDAELRVVWQAAGELGYPYGPLFRLLILTGQRENEVGGMSWPEIDFDNALWTIPAERMKMETAHEVPLPPAAVKILKALPQFSGKEKSGEFVFSTMGGARPVNGFAKAKVRIDGKITEIRAKERGAEKPEECDALAAWVIHDLRRTMRTRLSKLPVEDIVRELVIAHAKRGLHKVYDQHAYQDEKRQCLRLWEVQLRGILKPKQSTVADLDQARAKRASRRRGAVV